MDPRPPVLPRIRPLLLPFVVLLFAIGVAACGDDDEPNATGDGGTTTTAPDDGEDDPYGGSTDGDGKAGGTAGKGTIVAEDYSLTDITVAPGAKIKLKNEGELPHTATADEGEFDLGEVEAGSTSEPGTAPDEPGAYAFHCEIHSSMKATLTVEG